MTGLSGSPLSAEGLRECPKTNIEKRATSRNTQGGQEWRSEHGAADRRDQWPKRKVHNYEFETTINAASRTFAKTDLFELS